MELEQFCLFSKATRGEIAWWGMYILILIGIGGIWGALRRLSDVVNLIYSKLDDIESQVKNIHIEI